MYRQQEPQYFPGYPGMQGMPGMQGVPGMQGMQGFPSTDQYSMGYPGYSEGNIDRRLRRVEREINRLEQRVRRIENRIGGMYGR